LWPAPPCNCDHDDFDCANFSTRAEAQACIDYWWTQAGCDIHHLDNDDDGVACQPTPVPRAEYVLRWVTDNVNQYTY
jgi:hypothetical protein